MHHLDTLSYLENGNDRQRKAYNILVGHRIFQALKDFAPILTGTIPLEIDIESSDLDIICYWNNKKDFIETLKRCFCDHDHFEIQNKTIGGNDTVVAYFKSNGFVIEIFGQNMPTKEQAAYRHMIVEYEILTLCGESFRRQVIDLKRKGIKTETAFAQLLNLEGDPYQAMLNVKFS